VNRPDPTPIQLSDEDGTFLISVAEHVLGPSTVAATNAVGLAEHGFEASRVDALIPWTSTPIEWRGYVFKKVEADPESPENFGFFVRRRLSTPYLH
jgi:hypothetical protein